jgi:hypothetical protein|tara:strand:- start:33 stop:389 length:357 start_codon:yes stop_codon:yes gene_type:complete
MRTLNDYFITGVIPNVSSASETFVAIPDGGRIIKIITHNAVVTTGTAAITFKIGASGVTPVAITGSAISHTASGSANRVLTSEPTAANRVEENDAVMLKTDGNSTNTSAMAVTLVIRR